MHDRFKDTQYIDPSKVFQDFRLVNLSQAKTPRKESREEIFFTVKRRTASENNGQKHREYNRIYGYVKITPIVKEVMERHLFHERRDNVHINLIEWDDRYLIVVVDGMYISSYDYFATKANVNALFPLETGADINEDRQEVAATEEQV